MKNIALIAVLLLLAFAAAADPLLCPERQAHGPPGRPVF